MNGSCRPASGLVSDENDLRATEMTGLAASRRRTMKPFLRAGLLFAIALISIACAGPEATATSTPAPTFTPVATRAPVPSPTFRPASQTTRVPTPTAGRTPTPVPAATPVPTPTPTPTPAPTPSATPTARAHGQTLAFTYAYPRAHAHADGSPRWRAVDSR